MTTTVTVVNKLHDKGARTGHWTVEANGRTVSGPHRLKRVAMQEARKAARQRAPAVLKEQLTDGTWRTIGSY